MLPSKPSASHRPNDQQSSIRSPPESRNDWGDANGQVDYFASAGFNNDYIYSAALTPGGTYVSISPIRPSGRPGNTAPTGQLVHTSQYPSQELNHRYGDLQQMSPPESVGSSKLSHLPPPLPPPKPDCLASTFHAEEVTSMGAFGSTFHAEEVTSMATGPSKGFAKKTHAEEVTSAVTGLSQDLDNLSTHTNSGKPNSDGTSDANVLDSFEIDGIDTDYLAAGQPKTEGLDGYSSDDNLTPPKRVSTSPSPKAKKPEPRASKSRKGKKTKKGAAKKGAAMKAAGAIVRPTGLDILRGRGGLTNRHKGNMKFRDEARKLRADYRDYDTSRHEKFLLSQELARRVKEYGGRFLEKGGDHLWYEMSEKDARKKASQVLREAKWE